MTLDATSLVTDTTYYFNVLVRDLAGNEAAYTMISATDTNPIFMFSTAAATGTVASRAAGDVVCDGAVAAYPSLPIADVKIFISFEDDSIVDMPGTGPSYTIPIDRFMTGPTGDVISSDWAGMFDGNIDQSLTAAGIVTGTYWWSGSDSAGEITAPNCSFWIPQAADTGIVGYNGTAAAAWINHSTPLCSTSAQFICLAWD